VGRYLDILRRAEKEAQAYDINDINDKSVVQPACKVPRYGFGRFCRFGRTLSALEARCPDRVPTDRWQQAVEDGRTFLAHWADQAHALRWTAKDLFGLLPVPAHRRPSFNRLARYDEIGLIWLLQGRSVAALTEATAAIRNPTGSITVYRRHNKPALGPLGDSLDDLTG
jgi:hypothetical protein